LEAFGYWKPWELKQIFSIAMKVTQPLSDLKEYADLLKRIN